MTAEKMLKDGINDGRYANILDTINPDMSVPMLKNIIEFAQYFAEEYARQNLREELIRYTEWETDMNFLNGLAYINNEQSVNEYLKQRE